MEYAETALPETRARGLPADAGLFLGLLVATLGGMLGCYLVFFRPLLAALGAG